MEIKKIEHLIGIPFSKNGDNPKTGFNCWSFVKYVLQEYYNIQVPDYGCFYCNPLDLKLTTKSFLDYKKDGRWVQVEKPIEPCVVLIRNQSIFVNHAGIYIGNNKFLHCLLKTGVILSDINDRYWKPKIDGYYVYQERGKYAGTAK